MAQGGDEQAATRALADSAQDRQGRMFDTHHHWLNVALKQNDELMRRIAAEQDLALKLVIDNEKSWSLCADARRRNYQTQVSHAVARYYCP
jgi:hypothetical protein